MHIALCQAFESIKLWIILKESVPSTIIPRVYRLPFNISLLPTHKQKSEKSSDRQIPIPSFCFLASLELRESQPLAGAETCRTSLCLKVAPRWCRHLLSTAFVTGKADSHAKCPWKSLSLKPFSQNILLRGKKDWLSKTFVFCNLSTDSRNWEWGYRSIIK